MTKYGPKWENQKSPKVGFEQMRRADFSRWVEASDALLGAFGTWRWVRFAYSSGAVDRPTFSSCAWGGHEIPMASRMSICWGHLPLQQLAALRRMCAHGPRTCQLSQVGRSRKAPESKVSLSKGYKNQGVKSPNHQSNPPITGYLMISWLPPFDQTTNKRAIVRLL